MVGFALHQQQHISSQHGVCLFQALQDLANVDVWPQKLGGEMGEKVAKAEAAMKERQGNGKARQSLRSSWSPAQRCQ